MASASYDDGADDRDEEKVELPSLTERIEWFEDWEIITRPSRALQRRDRDYYDGIQWTQTELDILKKRGQPASINNRIARKVNVILGDEIDKRFDAEARPRTKQHSDSARAVTDALRFVADQQKCDQVKTAVMKNVVIEGNGAALKSIDEEGKHCLEHIQWDRQFADPHSRDVDYSDAKYKGIILWMDLDDAIGMWPDAAEDLRAALSRDIGNIDQSTADVPRRWADRKDNRIKICEMYFKIGKNWYRSIFTDGADIEKPARTAYLDEQLRYSVCPLVMVSCYVDQEGNRYGVVRNLVSRQDAINKRESKALHLLSVRNVIAERDSVRDPEAFMDKLAKPDGYAEVEPGALTESRMQITQSADLAMGHVQLMQQAINDIDGVGPNTNSAESLPADASGRAIISRQKAASKEIQPVFDAMRMWFFEVTTLDWLCIRQHWGEEKWMRVTDDTELNGFRFVGLNRSMTRAERFQELLQKQPPVDPHQALEIAAGTDWAMIVWAQAEHQAGLIAQQAQAMHQQPPPPDKLMPALILQDPIMGEEITVDQVDQLEIDIIIDTVDNVAVIEQEEFEQWTTLAPSLVQGGLDPREAAKLTIELSQFRDKKRVLEILNRPPPPGQQQQQQQIQQLQMQMAQLQASLVQAQANKANADAELSHAKAQTEMADSQQPPGGMSPTDQVHVQREQLGAHLDVAKAQAQIDKDNALTAKHQTDQKINIVKAQQSLAQQPPGLETP